MSKEKGCECCKQIWYVELDTKLKLCPDCYEYCKPLFDDLKIKYKQIADLEAKLAESEKKAYSRGHSQRDIANEIKLNALKEDVANKEKRIVELKQQLAITEKALELACEEITGSCEYCSYKTRIECPVEADCLNEKINYFKSKAKEIINGYKQDD